MTNSAAYNLFWETTFTEGREAAYLAVARHNGREAGKKHLVKIEGSISFSGPQGGGSVQILEHHPADTIEEVSSNPRFISGTRDGSNQKCSLTFEIVENL